MALKCIIVGGGASGLAAAAYLSRNDIPFVLLEKLDRVGKKLLATGNGRCNYSNTDLSPFHYGKASAFVEQLWQSMSPEDVLSFFSSLGLMSHEEEGRLYPRTLSASSVLDALRLSLKDIENKVCLHTEVTELKYSSGSWIAKTSGGAAFSAPYLIICAGGSAAPKFGTNGAGFRLLHALGHSIQKPVPALVQLKCKHSALSSLKGMRTRAAIELHINGSTVAAETGELLFTEYGLSGICVFQVSGVASRALSNGQRVDLLVDFLPELADGPVSKAWLDDRIRLLPDREALQLLTGVFPRLLTQAIIREAGISAGQTALSFDEDQRNTLLRVIHHFPFFIDGTNGFDNAQVTSGGVHTQEVNPRSMESRLHPGLFIAGETLDVDGPCGGYNLHFAFASGLCAARSVQRKE